MSSDRTRRVQLPIAGLLMILLSTLVIVSVIPLGLLAYFGAGSATRELMVDRSELTIDRVEDSFIATLRPVEAQVRFIAQALAEGRPEPDSGEHFEQFMLGSLAAAPQVSGVVFIRPDGSTLLFNRSRRAVSEEPIDRIVIAPEALRDARQSKQVRWGRGRWSRLEHQPILTVRAPVYRGDELRGVVAAAIRMADLSERVTLIGSDSEQTPFILEGRDEVLAHPRLTNRAIIAQLDDRAELPGLDDVGDPVLAGFWSLERNELHSRTGMVRSQGHWSWVGSATQAYVYRTIEGYGPDTWTVGVHEPGLNTRFQRWTVRSIGLTAIALLLFGVLTAFLLARRIARPIHALSRAADKVGDFSFGAMRQLPRTAVSEINEAAAALERMASGLKWFETYLPRAQVRRLMSLGAEASASELKTLTIMFFDVAGFSSYSRGREPKESAAFLSEVFGAIGPVIEDSGGTIDKYTGDGLLAFWGAPGEMPDHAARACKAALQASAALDAMMEDRRARGLPICASRIGLHTGSVIVGNLGFEGRVNYTVVGSTVNEAQRIEEAGRDFLGDALSIVTCSDATRQAAPAGFAFEALFDVQAGSHLPGQTVWRLSESVE